MTRLLLAVALAVSFTPLCGCRGLVPATDPSPGPGADAAASDDAARVRAALAAEEVAAEEMAAEEVAVPRPSSPVSPTDAAASPEPSSEAPFESISTLELLPPSEHPERRSLAHLSSRGLRRALTARTPLRQARRAAGRDRDYRVVAFRLAGEDAETQLRAAVETYLRPDPMDFVYYGDAERAESVTAAAFELGDVLTEREQRALERLAAALDVAASSEGLRVFALRAGWSDAVGAAYHGVALVDPRTGEALWVFGAATWSA